MSNQDDMDIYGDSNTGSNSNNNESSTTPTPIVSSDDKDSKKYVDIIHSYLLYF